ncbi:MAG: AsmA-like C-terminal region-containing protein, partial [Candidatus Omnitrophota bacterium]
MKRKIIIIFLILVILIAAGTAYLNRVVLPVKIKSLVIQSLEEATGKKATLESLQFNIFKGLVIKNLILSDGQKMLLSLKEASCTFLIWPFFKKQIIIPAVFISSAEIFLERRQDNTFNLTDLFLPKKNETKSKFNLFVSRVIISDSAINFRDNTLTPAFTKTMSKLNMAISLSLPKKVKLSLDSEITAAPNIKIMVRSEFDIPQQQLNAKIDLVDFSPGEFSGYYQNLGISSAAGYLKGLNFTTHEANLEYRLKDRQLGLSGRANIRGPALKARFDYGLQAKFPAAGQPEINSSVTIHDAEIKPENLTSPIKFISGEIQLQPDRIAWSGLNFKYLDVPYETSGSLTDFKLPQVALRLSSADLFVESNFTLNDKLIKISKCAGRYLDSEFSAAGNINAQSAAELEADISAGLNINLEDIQARLDKFKEQLEKIALRGRVNVKLDLSGNLKEIKSCVIRGELRSPSLSAYGLKANDFFLDYRQADGLIDVPQMRLSLYDGILTASGKMNLSSPNLPYWVEANIQGLKIEKLKQDTAAKGKDISGILAGRVKVNGFSADLSRLSGQGEVFITDGNLWQLNLFKGLGALLFSADFNNVVFSKGYCAFSIRDKSVFTDNFRLESNLVTLNGSGKIGFDSSIDASLNAQVAAAAPLSGTFKDITTVIFCQAGRFGLIR